MAGKIDARLAELGIVLPVASAPAAAYVNHVTTGDLVFISGQIAADENGLICGKLGDDVDVAQGKVAARTCALSLLSKLSVACDGDLDRVTRVVKITGFVNATGEFGEHHLVINGASEFLSEVFGDVGAHARAAVGAPSLPFGVAVEVEGIFQIN